MDWLSAVDALATQAVPAVLVTVAQVAGSGPRETGAKMLVTAVAQFDTIGGGHLELRACEIARAMLAQPGAQLDAQRRVERFPLGPSLGQCCGGVVHLAFERIDPAAYAVYRRLGQRWRARCDSWRLLRLDAAQVPLLCDAEGAPLDDACGIPLPQVEPDGACRLLRDDAGHAWLLDPCRAHRSHLVLFGAGHVGAAIVRALGELPCHVTWVDEREELFPAIVPANVQIEITDAPETAVEAAPAGASFLVMTHSHALDQQLSEAILRRADAGWFGLIGSKTKRMQFEHRLSARGIAPERLAWMTCPIGLPGIEGKAPAVIAASVCAQLLMVWQEAEQARRQAPSAQHVDA